LIYITAGLAVIVLSDIGTISYVSCLSAWWNYGGKNENYVKI